MGDELGEKLRGFETRENSFGPCVEKATHPPLMLEFHHQGNRTALPYNFLITISFDPSAHLELEFSSRKVVLQSVKPKSLEPLFELLAQHLVTRVSEIDELSVQKLSVPIVTKIRVEPLL